MTDTAPGPLSGTLVVDLSRALAGLHAMMMFGDLGARRHQGRGTGGGGRHPRVGAAVRLSARRRGRGPAGSPATSCRLTATRIRSLWTLKAEDDRALALLPADRVIAAEHAWLSPLPLEGASAIVYHHTEHAPLLAERQKISCLDLLDENIGHVVVPERPAAQENPQGVRAGHRRRMCLGHARAH